MWREIAVDDRSPKSHTRMSKAHDPLYIEFVAKLRAARKTKGISQQELGKRIGKEQSFVSKVETCERRLDLIEAARWCAVLDIQLEDVLPSEITNRWEDL